ncbi:uncharacterized protein DFL_001462 [Arthrobotrys flagrans]|uniref:Uncharacterized protein n=1 Tax=Arthrobotrys flagrans TaxID=97331 RepID=A0A437A7Q7_ARTFL|nr:hypothetical protein DFL_001462 [Arthrobotrys flagrans]
MTAFLSRKAKAFQRILVFVGANETGGHAYLYRMLQATRHPLYIVYAVRRPTDGTLPFQSIQKNGEFQKALDDTNSSIFFYELPGVWIDFDAGRDWVTTARNPIIRCSKAHGERPISYLFVNGHENFGIQHNLDENKISRQLRLEKYWAPYKDALHTIARPDKDNPFDHQICFVTTKLFVTQMSAMLTALLPLVRNDGEGVVVLKTPRDGRLEIIGSRRMRADFVHPTPHFYQSAVLDVRSAADRLLKRKHPHEQPWPHQQDWLQLGDIFAKSAITMYKSFTPFENITFHRRSHDYDDIDGPVSLLLNPDVPRPTPAFDEDDLFSVSQHLISDVEDERMPGSLVRRTVNPYVLSHNQGRNTRSDWVTNRLTGQLRKVPGGGDPGLVRSVFPKMAIDEGGVPSRYTPFDQRNNPPIRNPTKGPKC